MEANYYAEDDTLVLTANRRGRSGGTLRDDFGIILTFVDEDSEDITRIRVLHATDFLPLDTERGYNADADTLTLGDKPDANCRVVETGDFVGYWQECDGGRYWDVVAVDLRRASVHLAPVLAALPQPMPAGRG